MLARVFEEAGLSTTALALIRNHAERAKPPRALFVPFPLGFALGKPSDPAFQHRVLKAAFGLLEADTGPVLADFEEGSDAPAELLQASEAMTAGKNATGDTPAAAADAAVPAANAASPAADAASPAPAPPALPGPADEVTALRGYYERWLAEHEGRTMVALTGIPQRRWRGLIRFLEAYADGREAWYAERPPDLPLARFLRYAADDIKSYYFEARMARRPDQRDNDLHRWFWTETAMGGLLTRVADRMTATGDPEMGLYARGIAR